MPVIIGEYGALTDTHFLALHESQSFVISEIFEYYSNAIRILQRKLLVLSNDFRCSES